MVSLWLGLFAFVGATFAATFTAALERDTITLGESVRLGLTLEGVQPKDPPAPPGVANLQIAYNGQASQFQIRQRTIHLLGHLQFHRHSPAGG